MGRAITLRIILCVVVLLLAVSTADAVDTQDLEVLKEEVIDAARNPHNLNAVLQPLVQKAAEGPLDWLDDLELRFKYFNGEEIDDNASFGLAYSFARQIAGHDLIEPRCETSCKVLGLDLDFRASGNVAFDRDTNPTDFLDTKLAIGLFAATGGPTGIGGANGLIVASEERDELDAKVEADLRERHRASIIANNPTSTEADRQAVEERAAREAAELPVTQFMIDAHRLAVLTSDDVAELQAIESRLQNFAADHLDDLFVVELDGEVSAETNQDFSAHQFVYGGRLSFTMQGYGSLFADEYSEVGWIGWANVPDWGPGLLRAITGSGPKECRFCFLPRGETFPIMTAGVGFVDVGEDPARAATGDTDDFPRADFETAFSTLAFNFGDTPVDFSAYFRLYREIGASDAITAADLDASNYVALTLGPRNGVFIGYSAGRLPFDLQNQQVVKAGLKADIGAIKDLLFK